MKKIILGVTGSVAAIKVLTLVNLLKKFAEVRIVTTEQGIYFFQSDVNSLTELEVSIYRDVDEWPVLKTAYKIGEPILHIELRRWADLLLIAPLDANTLAKIVHGLCDNLLTSIVRAWDWNKAMVLCPAMNTMMWNNPPTMDHIEILTKRGATVIAPIEKTLACLDVGMGGMAEVDQIVNFIKANHIIQNYR